MAFRIGRLARCIVKNIENIWMRWAWAVGRRNSSSFRDRMEAENILRQVMMWMQQEVQEGGGEPEEQGVRSNDGRMQESVWRCKWSVCRRRVRITVWARIGWSIGIESQEN